MNTRWMTGPSGEVIFEQQTPMQARIIVGSLFSLFALFFGYYLFSGLIEYIRSATAAEWLQAIPGTLVVLVLFLLFAIPAFGAFVARSKVIVDTMSGSITEILDFRIYKRTRSTRIDQVKAARIGEQHSRHKSGTSISYAIQLVLRNEKMITVSYEDQIPDAREVAAQLAAILRPGQLPVIDDTASQAEDA